jgi:hypothetical protein
MSARAARAVGGGRRDAGLGPDCRVEQPRARRPGGGGRGRDYRYRDPGLAPDRQARVAGRGSQGQAAGIEAETRGQQIQEDARAEDGVVRVLEAVEPGRFIRRAGLDFTAGPASRRPPPTRRPSQGSRPGACAGPAGAGGRPRQPGHCRVEQPRARRPGGGGRGRDYRSGHRGGRSRRPGIARRKDRDPGLAPDRQARVAGRGSQGQAAGIEAETRGFRTAPTRS